MNDRISISRIAVDPGMVNYAAIEGDHPGIDAAKRAGLVATTATREPEIIRAGLLGPAFREGLDAMLARGMRRMRRVQAWWDAVRLLGRKGASKASEVAMRRGFLVIEPLLGPQQVARWSDEAFEELDLRHASGVMQHVQHAFAVVGVGYAPDKQKMIRDLATYWAQSHGIRDLRGHEEEVGRVVEALLWDRQFLTALENATGGHTYYRNKVLKAPSSPGPEEQMRLYLTLRREFERAERHGHLRVVDESFRARQEPKPIEEMTPNELAGESERLLREAFPPESGVIFEQLRPFNPHGVDRRLLVGGFRVPLPEISDEAIRYVQHFLGEDPDFGVLIRELGQALVEQVDDYETGALGDGVRDYLAQLLSTLQRYGIHPRQGGFTFASDWPFDTRAIIRDTVLDLGLPASNYDDVLARLYPPPASVAPNT